MIYQPTNFRTDDELAELKRQWLYDNCWDIWATSGFEFHREELKQWQQDYFAQQELKRQKQLLELAEVLGIPGNTKLAAYIQSMERTIKSLTERIDELEDEQSINSAVRIWGAL